MDDTMTSFCSSKFPCVRDRISLKFIGNFGTRPQKHSPALYWPHKLGLFFFVLPHSSPCKFQNIGTGLYV